MLPKTKGPLYGKCNICEKGNQKLTSDHVPPKGTLKYPRMRLHSLIDFLGVNKEFQKGKHFQNGVKFRTICEHCNSKVIGSLYDPALVQFANEINNFLHNQQSRPQIKYFNTQPDLIARAIAGHVLALGVEHFPRGEMGDALAKFVLEPTSAAPRELGVYYWAYPYWEQISIRAFGLLLDFGTPPLTMSLIKFNPIAFMLTWKADPGFQFSPPNLMDYIPNVSGGQVQIPLDFRKIPSSGFPERPDSNGIAFHGDKSYVAVPDKQHQ
jgi:hypothetical protein